MESKIVIRGATVEDALFIGQHMRRADQREIWASNRHVPDQTAKECIEHHNCQCVEIDGLPSIFFGCEPHVGGYGVPWLLATDDINKIGVRFILGSRPIVKAWLQEYKLLTNWVHADNELSMRWLEWLGFRLVDKGLANGELFYRFEIKEEC